MEPSVRQSDDALVRTLLPYRRPDGNKGTFGKAALLCGSEAYPGAALLACEACLRTGVGMTVLYAPSSVCRMAIQRRPETVCRNTDIRSAGFDFQAFFAAFRKADAMLIGCGCTADEKLASLIADFLVEAGAPVILDADAINSLSLDRNLCKQIFANNRKEVVLTPHPLEFSRLTGHSVSEIEEDRIGYASRTAVDFNAVILLKGKNTVIASPDGRVTVNSTGSTALAKGGSGDVLSGAIVSFLAQGMSAYNAATVAAYLHGKAAESLSLIFSERGVLPSELPAQMAKELACIR